MSQIQWTRLPAHDSGAPPALAIAEGSLLLVAVTPEGEVVFTRSTTLGDGWEPWMSVVATGMLKAAPDTAPLLVTVGGAVHLLCRGADDNLHVARHLTGSNWEPWRSLTVGGEVTGGFSAAVTTQGSTQVHLAHSAPGPRVDYLVLDSSWRAVAPSLRWPDAVEAQVASDGGAEVALGLRTPDDRLVMHARTTSGNGWRPVGERPRCLSLSNGVHFANAFHFAYMRDVVVDDVGLSSRRRLAHARFRDHEDDDGYDGVIHDYAEHVRPRATLTTYRNKLVAVFVGDALAVRAAYWDTADPVTPWIDLGAVAGGRTTNPPAVVGSDFAAGLSAPDRLLPNYGNDLFAAVTGGTTGGLWVVNLSRAFFGYRLADLDLGVDWCMNYSGSRAMGQCTSPATPVPAVTDLAVYTEAGFGSLTYPDWLIRAGVRLTLDHLGWGRAYVTWVHGQVFQDGSSAYYGPEINVNHLSQHLDWVHEMGHRLVSSAGIWNSGDSPSNPPLLRALLPAAATAAASSLFGTATTAAGTCSRDRDALGRCRGFDGLYGSDEITGTQHALIYLLQSYLAAGDRLRECLYDDLRAGDDLLLRKYQWIRDWIFRGVEFRGSGEPLVVVSLVNKHSGMALDVVGRDLEDHAQVQQYTPHGGDNQRWALVPDGTGHYHLTAMHSGKCLDVAKASTDDGATVQLYGRHEASNQKWSLVPDGNGGVEIVAACSGKCLDVTGWGTSDGVRVQQYARHGGDNQKWLVRHLTRF